MLSCRFVSSMPVVSFGNTLTTSASEDASREDGASLFFSVSFRGLDLGFCCVSSVQLGRGLYYLLRPVWMYGRCGCGLCRRLLWCFFFYRSSLPRSPKRILYLLEVQGLRVLAPLLAPLFTQMSQLCPPKFEIRGVDFVFSECKFAINGSVRCTYNM